MASNDVRKQFKQFTDDLQKTLVRAKSREEYEAIGDFSVELIRKRARLGYGILGGEKIRFPGLSQAYIKQRRGDRQGLDSTTSPTKSNVTYTGQLLRSLGYRYTTKDGVIITVEGTRKDGKTNLEIAKHLAKKHNRIFIGLTKSEIRQLAKFYRDRFTKVLKKTMGSRVR